MPLFCVILCALASHQLLCVLSIKYLYLKFCQLFKLLFNVCTLYIPVIAYSVGILNDGGKTILYVNLQILDRKPHRFQAIIGFDFNIYSSDSFDYLLLSWISIKFLYFCVREVLFIWFWIDFSDENIIAIQFKSLYIMLWRGELLASVVFV